MRMRLLDGINTNSNWNNFGAGFQKHNNLAHENSLISWTIAIRTNVKLGLKLFFFKIAEQRRNNARNTYARRGQKLQTKDKKLNSTKNIFICVSYAKKIERGHKFQLIADLILCWNIILGMSSSKLDKILLGPTCFRVVDQTRPAKHKQQRELNAYTLERTNGRDPAKWRCCPSVSAFVVT